MTLPEWLARLERLHPREIDPGLERVGRVAEQMGLRDGFPRVITVAGTNGKGSCVTALESLLAASGVRSGAHTSPHLLRYNERIRVDGEEVDDRSICRAFEEIDRARNGISLTYFEFGVLAALYVFRARRVDVVVLETGLGGRLDAVNVVDTDLAVITSIGLDHQEWLGADREAIGREKAGIFRKNIPVVCVDPEPPESLRAHVRDLACPWYGLDGPLSWEVYPDHWDWSGSDSDGRRLEAKGLPLPGLALSNVSAALQVLALLALWPGRAVLERVLPGLQLAGRQQLLRDTSRNRRVLLDVAHNGQAAVSLAQRLHTLRLMGARVHAVLAMMSDKDHAAFFHALESEVDFWYITQVEQSRCLPAEELYGRLQALGASAAGKSWPTAGDAYEAACTQSHADDLILVCGSFHTVAAVMERAGTSFTPDSPLEAE